MTSAHIIFIPGVLVVGMFLGFLIGGRAALDRMNLERRREEERQKAREARAARNKAAESDS